MLLLGYRQVSAPLVKLQKTLKESLEQPWLGSIQYSPAEGDRETKQGGKPDGGSRTLSRWRLHIWVDSLTVFELRLAEVQVLAGAGRAVLGAERETHSLDLLSQ